MAGISIATLFGEDGLITKAIKAKEETEIQAYYEKIEMVRTELKLENPNYESPSLVQLQNEFDTNHKKWVAQTKIEVIEGLETLILTTKEGYIFYITTDGTEYKGKGKVEDTSDLKKDSIIKLEITGEATNGKLVKITNLSEKSYYKIEYQIDSQDEQWTKIESGNTVEVKYGSTIYARLVYGSNRGITHSLNIEHSVPAVVAKSIDTNNIVRKTNVAFPELFEITWGSEGTGTVEYSISGNLNFKNTNVTNASKNNLSELEIGTYTITCKVSSPSNIVASAQKQIQVNKLASTSVTNKSNQSVNASAIYSEYDLAYFRDLVNAGQNSINAKIMQGLNLSKVCSNTVGNWDPIGNSSNLYKGIFDGAEQSIDSIYHNSNNVGVGLFGYIEQARICNVTLQSGTIQANYDVGGVCGNCNESNFINCKNQNVSVIAKEGKDKKYFWSGNQHIYTYSDVGGIVGYSYNSNINSCINCGNISSSYSAVGGIVGFDDGNKNRTISNCKNTAKITLTQTVIFTYGIGGIVGESYKQGIIQNCNNSGQITGSYGVGGITGEMTSGTLNNCVNTGNITGSSIIGGIIGQLDRATLDTSSTLNNSINEGTIKSTGYFEQTGYYYGTTQKWNDTFVGGIIGVAVSGNINSCKNKGSVLTTSSYGELGGIAGYVAVNTTIKKCSNYKDISNTNINDIGGIIGFAHGSGNESPGIIIEECFNTGNISGKNDIGGIIGSSTYMTLQNCYNIGHISGVEAIGGFIGLIGAFEFSSGYNYIYNCYNIGMVTGNSKKDAFVGESDYLTYNYLYTTKTLYDQIGDGVWTNTTDGVYDTLSGSSIENTMLTNLLNENGSGKWTRDTSGKINNGYPYLVNNP